MISSNSGFIEGGRKDARRDISYETMLGITAQARPRRENNCSR
jgi:hypothetical protein